MGDNFQCQLYLQSTGAFLGMALMALTGRRPAEIFFSAKFTLPDKSSPSLPSSSRASSKPVTLPAQVQSLTPSPSWLPQSAFWPLLSASALIRTYPDAQRAILAQRCDVYRAT
jgi:hypothetical protein